MQGGRRTMQSIRCRMSILAALLLVALPNARAAPEMRATRSPVIHFGIKGGERLILYHEAGSYLVRKLSRRPGSDQVMSVVLGQGTPAFRSMPVRRPANTLLLGGQTVKLLLSGHEVLADYHEPADAGRVRLRRFGVSASVGRSPEGAWRARCCHEFARANETLAELLTQTALLSDTDRAWFESHMDLGWVGVGIEARGALVMLARDSVMVSRTMIEGQLLQLGGDPEITIEAEIKAALPEQQGDS